MTIDPALTALLSQAFETGLNKALQYDPGTLAQLRQLDGRSLTVCIEDLKLSVGIHFQDEHLRLSILPSSTDNEQQCDVELRGKLADLLALLRQTHTLADSGVEVRGKVGLLESIQSVAKNIDIDWEDAIYDSLGPIFSQPLIFFIRNSLSYAREVTSNGAEVIAEFVEHEAGIGVHREVFSAFSDEVDALRSQSDRLQAKLRQFQAKVESRLS